MVARLALIPLFLVCNYDPSGKRTAAVLIQRDWVYCLLSVVQGLSLGYLGSLAMMYAPRCVSNEDAQTAGMMAGHASRSGIFAGILTGFLWQLLV